MYSTFVSFQYWRDMRWVPGSVVLDLDTQVKTQDDLLFLRDHIAAIFKFDPASIVVTGFQVVSVSTDSKYALVICPHCHETALSHVCGDQPQEG